jgi:CRISPR/Cas system-associated exonuclease Cas4 (RecB family)
MSPRGRRIAASEVGQYAYCARAWWLSAVQKLEPTYWQAIDDGTAAHERHGWQVVLARGLARLALVLLGMAVLLLLGWGITRP